MRLLAVADQPDDGLWHDPRAVGAVDLVVAAGDLPFEYLGRLQQVLDAPLVFVPGNHDPDVTGYRVARNGLVLRAGLPSEPPWPSGACNADGRVLDVAGLRIAGLGGSVRYGDGPNQYTQRQQRHRARRLAVRARWRSHRDGRPVDVLLTHAPPRGVGDGPDAPHRGFDVLVPLAAHLRVPLLLHGHVALAGGRREHRLGDTVVRNVIGHHVFDIEPATPAAAVERVVARDTGFPRADVENDFLRVRRRQVLARLAHRLLREPDDVNLILPFDEVVAALGYEGERQAGMRTIKLAAVVGTVDSTRDFDRQFRPTSACVRERWERLALAQRRGQALPPIDVYRIGEMYFVRDGHHRVSVALASGATTIDAYVTEVRTALPAKDIRSRRDLVVKSYERMFAARVPLPPAARARIVVTDPWSYAELGEAVEAWGFRFLQHEHRFRDRAEIALRWFDDEFTPVVKMLKEADLLGAGTEAEAYLRVASERYRLILTHEWNDEVIRRLREPLHERRARHRSPSSRT